MKLLVPIDGTSESLNALKKSFQIANEYEFTIKIIKVIDPREISRTIRYSRRWHQVDGSIISDEVMKPVNLQARADSLLNEMTEKFNMYNVSVEKEVLIGKVHSKILETAHNEDFDLIVMGKRDLSKFKNMFTRSITKKVNSRSNCPVFIVPTN